MNTSLPDKKSVMMYIMCFFQALHNQSVPLRRLDSVDLSDVRFFYNRHDNSNVYKGFLLIFNHIQKIAPVLEIFSYV